MDVNEPLECCKAFVERWHILMKKIEQMKLNKNQVYSILADFSHEYVMLKSSLNEPKNNQKLNSLVLLQLHHELQLSLLVAYNNSLKMGFWQNLRSIGLTFKNTGIKLEKEN